MAQARQWQVAQARVRVRGGVRTWGRAPALDVGAAVGLVDGLDVGGGQVAVAIALSMGRTGSVAHVLPSVAICCAAAAPMLASSCALHSWTNEGAKAAHLCGEGSISALDYHSLPNPVLLLRDTSRRQYASWHESTGAVPWGEAGACWAHL